MKKAVLLIGLIGVVTISMSFKNNKTQIPPGTVQISDSFYVDKNEVTNVDWQEYMYWMKQVYGETSKEYQSCIPDASVWYNETLSNVQKKYFEKPMFAYYPVVGVSYEQAQKYCQWRSDRVNEMLWVKEIGKRKKHIKNKDFPKVFEYRLPSKKEWLKISQAPNLKDISKSTNHLTFPVNYSKKDGIFGLNTNVSEMISDKGVAMGGNWKTSDNYNEVKYSRPSNTIGFRCVCDKKVK